MENKNKFLITGILLSLLLFVNIMAFNPLNNANEFSSYNVLNLDKNIFNLPNIESNISGLNADNNTGCCSVIVHVQSGHDIISYRRDSGYAADITIENMSFNGQNAIHEYKTQNGYFTHTIITENGWIIGIGGKDNPNTNKELEKLGSDIISKGNIQKGDIEKANAIIKGNGWGHFVIKSPDDDIGITAYDSRTSSTMTKPSSMVELFKMKDGDYVKVPNNPQYYGSGQFNNFSSDPINAAIKIIGTDHYNDHGNVRRDVVTYDYTNDNTSKKVDVWASFDGGALLKGANGSPDNIKFFGNEIQANELPKIPDKKFLGEITLQNDNPSPKSSMNLRIVLICSIFGLGFVMVNLAKKRIFK